jgi:hypothetical protein
MFFYFEAENKNNHNIFKMLDFWQKNFSNLARSNQDCFHSLVDLGNYLVNVLRPAKSDFIELFAHQFLVSIIFFIVNIRINPNYSTIVNFSNAQKVLVRYFNNLNPFNISFEIINYLKYLKAEKRKE